MHQRQPPAKVAIDMLALALAAGMVGSLPCTHQERKDMAASTATTSRKLERGIPKPTCSWQTFHFMAPEH